MSSETLVCETVLGCLQRLGLSASLKGTNSGPLLLALDAASTLKG